MPTRIIIAVPVGSKKGIADLQSHGNETPLKCLSFNIIYIMRILRLPCASSAAVVLAVGDFKRLEICLLKWRLLKIKAIGIR